MLSPVHPDPPLPLPFVTAPGADQRAVQRHAFGICLVPDVRALFAVRGAPRLRAAPPGLSVGRKTSGIEGQSKRKKRGGWARAGCVPQHPACPLTPATCHLQQLVYSGRLHSRLRLRLDAHQRRKDTGVRPCWWLRLSECAASLPCLALVLTGDIFPHFLPWLSDGVVHADAEADAAAAAARNKGAPAQA